MRPLDGRPWPTTVPSTLRKKRHQRSPPSACRKGGWSALREFSQGLARGPRTSKRNPQRHWQQGCHCAFRKNNCHFLQVAGVEESRVLDVHRRCLATRQSREDLSLMTAFDSPRDPDNAERGERYEEVLSCAVRSGLHLVWLAIMQESGSESVPDRRSVCRESDPEISEFELPATARAETTTS